MIFFLLALEFVLVKTQCVLDKFDAVLRNDEYSTASVPFIGHHSDLTLCTGSDVADYYRAWIGAGGSLTVDVVGAVVDLGLDVLDDSGTGTRILKGIKASATLYTFSFLNERTDIQSVLWRVTLDSGAVSQRYEMTITCSQCLDVRWRNLRDEEVNRLRFPVVALPDGNFEFRVGWGAPAGRKRNVAFPLSELRDDGAVERRRQVTCDRSTTLICPLGHVRTRNAACSFSSCSDTAGGGEVDYGCVRFAAEWQSMPLPQRTLW